MSCYIKFSSRVILNPTKFFYTGILKYDGYDFLGHYIDKTGAYSLPDKVAAIQTLNPQLQGASKKCNYFNLLLFARFLHNKLKTQDIVCQIGWIKSES